MNQHDEDVEQGNQELEGVMRRVQKLLAIARDGRGDANEAAAAAAMAEKILRKYQLDHADLIAYQLKSEKGSVIMLPVFGNMKRDVPNRPPLLVNPEWCQHLCWYIANLNDCEVRQGFAPRPQTDEQHKRYGIIIDRCLEIYGYAADAQTAQWMYDYLVGHMVRASEQLRMPLMFSSNEFRKPTKVERNEFRRGFVARLCGKLELLARDKQQARLGHTAGSALVLAKKDALEQAFGEFKYEEAKEAKEIKDKRAFHMGVLEGDKVDVQRRAVGNAGASDDQPAKPLLLGN